MEYEMEDDLRSGPAAFALGFLGDLLWEIGQIGQALLDGATVVLFGLLIYHHGAVLNAARQAQHGPAEQGLAPPDAAARPAACGLDPVGEATCILAQVLQPSAT